MPTDPKFGTDFGSDSEVAGYVLFNRLVQRLNALVNSNPEGRQSAPPGSPSDGDHYIVESSPSGDWSTFAEHDLAVFFDGSSSSGWVAITPQEGWRAFVKDEDSFFVFDGTSWVDEATIAPTADIQVGPQRLLLDSDGNTNIDGSSGDDIAFTVGGDNSYTFSNTVGFQIIDRASATPTQMQIDQTSTAAYVGSAGFTTFTGDVSLGTGGGAWSPANLPAGYANNNPGWIKLFDGTAEIAIQFASLA